MQSTILVMVSDLLPSSTGARSSNVGGESSENPIPLEESGGVSSSKEVGAESEENPMEVSGS